MCDSNNRGKKTHISMVNREFACNLNKPLSLLSLLTEASKVDSSKQLKVRPLVSPRQPTTSKSGPVMSRSSLGGGHHRSEAEENQNGDNVSESGTYTIESEDQSKEVLEARSKIDEVFGVDASMDTRQGSDEDTDKDVGDGEIEEEAVTAEAVHTQQVDINRYLDQEYGKPNGQESVKPSDAHASFQVRFCQKLVGKLLNSSKLFI